MVIVNFKLAMNADNGSSALLNFTYLFEGRASALFVILAGVGIAFMTQKARMSGSSEDIQKARWSIIKRAILLVAAGLAFTPIWEADILRFYGFYFIIAAFLFNLSSKTLLLLTMGFVLTFPLLWVFLDYEHGWDLVNLSYSGFWTVDGMIRHIVFNGFHPIFPWCGFLIFGLWLARLDLTSSRVQRNLLVWSVIILIATEVGFYMLRFWAGDGTTLGMTKDEIDFLLSTSIIPPLPQYMLSAGSSAVIVLLACLKLSNARPASKLIGWISKTGQMTLTLYVAHVIVGMGSLEALGLLYNQSINVSLYAAVLFCVFSIIFSVLWLSRFPTGPLETIFKRLSQ
ncbi:membrane protein [Vibrio metoecus]|uniref:Membrane protein n=2 Tax=Vibrio metoecus TaxID=1481663 RepID=A0A0Q0TP49_VIBMT|nr:membrane protein [Vibrio metoecus]